MNYLLRILDYNYEVIQFSSDEGDYFNSKGINIPFSKVYIPYQRSPIIVKTKNLSSVADDLPSILLSENRKRENKVLKSRRKINGLILSGVNIKELKVGLEYKLLFTPCVVEEKNIDLVILNKRNKQLKMF